MSDRSAPPTVEALPAQLYAAYLAHLRACGVGAKGKMVRALAVAGFRVLRAKSPAARDRAEVIFAEVLEADMREWVDRLTV